MSEYLFHLYKDALKGRPLWLRATASVVIVVAAVLIAAVLTAVVGGIFSLVAGAITGAVLD